MEKLQLYHADNLLYLRKCLGKTQSQLSEATGLSRCLISNIELERSLPDVYDLVALCKYFNVSVDDFLTKKIKAI
jgi:transcriptional regulator with XRE-family HTH domain